MGKKLCDKGKRKSTLRTASYECVKCGLVAEKERHLCKPKKMKD